MQVNILIISHNGIGTAIKEVACSMFKHCPLRIELIAVKKKSDPDELCEMASKLIRELDQGNGVLILTDLIGSTPFNIAKSASINKNARVVSGLNLSMLIKVMNYPLLDLEKLSENAMNGGLEGIRLNKK